MNRIFIAVVVAFSLSSSVAAQEGYPSTGERSLAPVYSPPPSLETAINQPAWAASKAGEKSIKRILTKRGASSAVKNVVPKVAGKVVRKVFGVVGGITAYEQAY